MSFPRLLGPPLALPSAPGLAGAPTADTLVEPSSSPAGGPEAGGLDI
ncbi:MAG: hypothetical protein OXI48_02460 [bacterium]|nr:hypothetical protein [bacterium]